MYQVHAENADRFLLRERVIIQHVDVQDNGVWLTTRLGLKAQADPAMAFVGALEIPRGYGVAEGEKARLITAGFAEAANQQGVLLLEHRFDAFTRHIAICFAVNLVTDLHVIG